MLIFFKISFFSFSFFFFFLASIYTLFFISNIKGRIDFESETCVAKIGRHLGCYTNSNEASLIANGKRVCVITRVII